MTTHDHRVYDEDCYRCVLSRDETAGEVRDHAAQAVADVQNVPFPGSRQRKIADAVLASVVEGVVESLADSYAYDRWPEQTVLDDPELRVLARRKVAGWLARAGLAGAG